MSRSPWLALVASLAAACSTSHSTDVDGGDRSGPDTGFSRRDAGHDADLHVVEPDAAAEFCRTRKIDLLFMVDNSNSMLEEQTALAASFPALARALASGDADGDGVSDFEPFPDIHVGVVSSDMGNGGYTVPTCLTEHGDDGVLNTRGSRVASGCMEAYPSFLAYTSDAPGADVDAFAGYFTCVARLGTNGCGFEQPLESVLKAVTPSTSPVFFAGGTVGHADRENAGFLRPDSTVVLWFLTDENDCSTTDPALFASGPGNPYTGDLSLRCYHYPDAVQPISRYLSGFEALQAGRESPVLFVAVTGVPGDLAIDPGAVDYDALLADPRMQETPETVTMGGMSVETGQLNPVCTETGGGYAYPGRRLVELAREMPDRAVVQSICDPDYSPTVLALGRRIAALAPRHCPGG